MSFQYTINARGDFTPSSEQTLNRGRVVAFNLDTGADWSLVYIYSGTEPRLDSSLFGTESVRVADGGTIQSTAPIGQVFTLTVSEIPPGLDGTAGGSSGSIKVGGG